MAPFTGWTFFHIPISVFEKTKINGKHTSSFVLPRTSKGLMRRREDLYGHTLVDVLKTKS